MQANLFKILAVVAAFSTVQSAPVETAEGQVNGTQVNGTQANEAHANEAQVDDGAPRICPKVVRPHISTREKEGDIFARSCREYSCYADWQCVKWGCLECNLHFTPCGDSYQLCY
ncbi:hypothetical protein GE09DRAFT_1141505 [Coniochaeta sp. 2T2.1]|nr:hypothetical protein GE09DRAFT_1141505 [Coniochaeta sp. 2T2.1]